MALIGMAFGIGFTFGPLLGFLAVPGPDSPPGPWPGYAAAILSAVALALAAIWLPESRRPGTRRAERAYGGKQGWRLALQTPSIGLLLLATFACVFSFANFETTLSLLIKGSRHALALSSSSLGAKSVSTYAFIGFTLAVVQGGIVRRLADRVSEGVMASFGAGIQVLGFGLTCAAIWQESVPLLLVSLGIVVTGFAFMQPNLQSLLSRRTDPEQQGLILGVGQSVSSLARIVGAGVGIPLLLRGVMVPYQLAAGLMVVGLVLVLLAARSGADFSRAPTTSGNDV